MGEVRIPVSGRETTYWSSYMGQKLEEVVRDWVHRVESGGVGVWDTTGEPISTQHLRVAKQFLDAGKIG